MSTEADFYFILFYLIYLILFYFIICTYGQYRKQF